MELLWAPFLGNFVVASERYQNLHGGCVRVVVPFSLEPELKSIWEGIGVAEMLAEIFDDFSVDFQQSCSGMGTQTTDDSGSISSSSLKRRKLTE